ncbi:MAG: hypothetical protein FWD34_04150 [Oscillospiraceae bacterium]|nr:hypothetical protein [Oscillospiraceae bacterium]
MNNGKSSIIILNSVTEANKARRELSNYKIKCSVEKVTVKRGGCGFGIRVTDDPDKICRYLELIDIECSEVIR